MSDQSSATPNARIIDTLDEEVIESFLRLLRDKYRLADTANFFLEHNENTSGISVAITNQRDVVSHFITALKDPALSKAKLMEQVSNAEEHLRRAIIEPYELSINLRLESLFRIIEHYKEKVLPRGQQTGFATCPSLRQIEARVREIADLRNSGRSRKAKNIWDADWEDGVKAFVKAYELARELCLELEEYLVRVRQFEMAENNQSVTQDAANSSAAAVKGVKHLGWSHIIVGVVVGLVILALDHLVFRRWFGH